MTDLFEMLSTIARRRKTATESPFATAKTTEKWLRALPADSDYDTHHALVQGLERFNAENALATPERMKSLLAIEAAGMPLQARVVEQYVRNQAAFRLARQALWRESWVFWSLLAEAWLNLLRQAYRNPECAELKPRTAEIASRALRYAGLVMRWDFHQARTPAASVWRRVHKIYRLVEREGLTFAPVKINARTTHCAREYSLVVLMGLVHPVGYRPQEIESIAQILEGYEPLPLPETAPQRGVHSHLVDLSLSEGASVFDEAAVEGRRLRFFALRPLVEYLKSLDQRASAETDNGLTRQMASLIERGGIRRNRERTHRFGRVWAAAGIDSILAALGMPDPAQGRPALESWMLRDESTDGMGFALPEAPSLPHGRLVAVSWNPAENVWQLLASRWTREENGLHLVGMQRLSRHPKRVEVFFENAAADLPAEPTHAVFMPMAQTEQGASNLLLPRSHYRLGALLTLRDGDVLYRLRLGEVQEGHEGWLRVTMDVVGREQFAAAA